MNARARRTDLRRIGRRWSRLGLAAAIALTGLAFACSSGSDPAAVADADPPSAGMQQTLAEDLQDEFGFTPAESECISELLVSTYNDALEDSVDPVDVSGRFLAAADLVDEACLTDRRRATLLDTTTATTGASPDEAAFLAAAPAIDNRMTDDPISLLAGAKQACDLSGELGLPTDTFELILASDPDLTRSLAQALAPHLGVLLDPPELIAWVTLSIAAFCPDLLGESGATAAGGGN